MKSRSKSNNFIAILIALLLFALGFVLYFIHEQTQTEETSSQRQSSVLSTIKDQTLPPI